MSSRCGVNNMYWWIFFMNECYIIICYVSCMLICLSCGVIHG